MSEEERKKDNEAFMRASFKVARIDQELKLQAVYAGMVNPDDAVSLCDKEGITISDDFLTVSGAREAVEKLKTTKAYLFKPTTSETKPIPPPRMSAPASSKTRPGPGDETLHPMDRIARGMEKKG